MTHVIRFETIQEQSNVQQIGFGLMVSKDLQILHKIHGATNRVGVSECETVHSRGFL